MMKFHLDEHMPSAVAQGLRLRGVDVATTADAKLGGAKGRVVVTCDRDYLRLNARGMRNAGIAFLTKQVEIGATIEELLILAEVFTVDEMRNEVQFI